MGEARPKILIVDDDPMMGTTLRLALEDDFDVEVAPSAERAMERLSAARFDLTLCDLMMPRTNGMDLHRWLAERDPQAAARMLFMTGGAYTEAAAAFLRQAGRTHIEKPFRVDQLLSAIRGMIVAS